jgi:hypothetical protein
MHWFCPNDLSCCVSGTTQKYVVPRPLVLTIWPIKEGTNLTQKEIITLEEVGFSFYHSHVQSLFGSQSSSSSILHVPTMNAHNIVWLAHNLWWQEGEMAFCLQNNTPTIGRLTSYVNMQCFPHY